MHMHMSLGNWAIVRLPTSMPKYSSAVQRIPTPWFHLLLLLPAHCSKVLFWPDIPITD